METVGARIRHLRKSMNLNQDYFSKALNISQTHISKIESGIDNASNKLLHTIVSTFPVSYKWLKTGVGDMWAEEKNIVNSIDNSLEADNQLFKIISEKSKDLDFGNKAAISRMLTFIKFTLSAKYTTPTRKNLAITSMFDIFASTYLLFVESVNNCENPSYKSIDMKERYWRETCEKCLNNLKDEYFYKNDE